MMRRTWQIVAVSLFAALCATTALADVVDVGTVNFDAFLADAPGSPGLNTFDILNFTGDPNSGGNSFPPFFPVVTSLTFENLSLSLTEVDGTVLSPIVLDGTAGPGGSYFDNANFVDTLTFASATLTGEISPVSVTLSDGSVMTLGGDFSTAILPSIGPNLTASTDYAVISAETVTGTVPEPSIFALLRCGALLFMGLALRKYWRF